MNTKFFIPEIITIGDKQTASTPFNYNNGKPLFLGDVFTVSYEEDGGTTETFMVDIIEGQYRGVTNDPEIDTPLYIIEGCSITVLGSILNDPELIKMLTV